MAIRSTALVAMILAGCNGSVDVFREAGRAAAPETDAAPVSDGASGTDIVAATSDTCAVMDGVPYCWGSRVDDRTVSVPTRMGSVSEMRFRRITSGQGAHCAELSNGGVACFGTNADGELGQGDLTARPDPTAVVLPSSAARVRGHFVSFVARLDDRSLYLWGDNHESQIGAPGLLSTGTDALRPVPNPDGTDWIDADMGQGHACGIRAPGALYCWGRNSDRECGLGPDAPIQLGAPTRVGTAEDWLSVTTGQSTTCGIRVPGSLYCWGANDSGQIGAGDYETRDVPTQTGTDSDWTSVDLDTLHVCGIRRPGALYCWGRNVEGQLGVGDTVDRNTPTRAGEWSDWIQVSVGRFHTCGRRADNSLWCTGENENGRLGTGTLQRTNTMTRVLAPAD